MRRSYGVLTMSGAGARLWGLIMKTILAMTAAVAAMACSTAALADAVDWGQVGAPGDYVADPLVASSYGGLSVTATDGGAGFYAEQQDNGWSGGFLPGENLIQSVAADAITLTFSSAVNNLGFSLENNLYGVYTGTVTYYNGANAVFTQSMTQDTQQGEYYGEAPYFAYNGTITSVVVDTSGANNVDADGFAIGQLRFNDVAAAPEPGTWALMMAGVGLAGAALRRRRVATVAAA